MFYRGVKHWRFERSPTRTKRATEKFDLHNKEIFVLRQYSCSNIKYCTRASSLRVNLWDVTAVGLKYSWKKMILMFEQNISIENETINLIPKVKRNSNEKQWITIVSERKYRDWHSAVKQ